MRWKRGMLGLCWPWRTPSTWTTMAPLRVMTTSITGALQKKLGRWRERVTDVRYEIKYRTITREMDRVLIAYRYSASFRIAYDEEDQRWSRRIGENRLVLLYDDIQSRYYVLSGM